MASSFYTADNLGRYNRKPKSNTNKKESDEINIDTTIDTSSDNAASSYIGYKNGITYNTGSTTVVDAFGEINSDISNINTAVEELQQKINDITNSRKKKRKRNIKITFSSN